MKSFHAAGRLTLVLLLFGIGVYLVWQVGRRIRSHSSGPGNPVNATSVLPAIPGDATPPGRPSDSVSRDSAGAKAGSEEEGEPRLLKTTKGSYIDAGPILFIPGTTTLRDTSIPRLDKLVWFLKERPNLDVTIIGYADGPRRESANREMAVERAGVVRDYLIFQGIPSSRLQSKGTGNEELLESNETRSGRRANRRIEFLVEER
jgi:outer membrane protein OmpA-like peptidoglycan-associated protein